MRRVRIGRNYVEQPFWKVVLAVPLVYLPLFCTVPFVILGVLLVKTHLKHVGGMEIRPYRDFVPEWASHRYCWDTQPVVDISLLNPARYRSFWLFNCKLYCPLSVALFRYMVYLVQIVENWWCPFVHSEKHGYVEGAVDQSFWHVDPQKIVKLHPDDLNNPLWNDEQEAAAVHSPDAAAAGGKPADAEPAGDRTWTAPRSDS